MNYKQAWTPVAGRSSIVTPGDAGLKQIGFDILRLAAGERSQLAAEAKETALVVLGGTASVRGDGFAFDSVGGRKDVFSGLPATVYVPAGTACAIEGDVGRGDRDLHRALRSRG